MQIPSQVYVLPRDHRPPQLASTFFQLWLFGYDASCLKQSESLKRLPAYFLIVGMKLGGLRRECHSQIGRQIFESVSRISAASLTRLPSSAKVQGWLNLPSGPSEIVLALGKSAARTT